MKTASIILPTRDRVEGVLALIDSLNEMTTDIDSIEMFIKIDTDDVRSQAATADIVRRARFPVQVVVDERLEGYCSLNIFVNAMVKMATARWLWMLNDDVTVTTRGWDEILRAIPETKATRMGVLRCSYPYPTPRTDYNPNNIFPVVSRELTELIGHYSLTMYNDAYVDSIGEAAGTILMHGWNPKTSAFPAPDKEIVVSHRMVYDVVRKESEAQYQWKLTPDAQASLDDATSAAIRKVKEFLA